MHFFIARKEFCFDLEPPLPIAPRVVDMLLIDCRAHVRRYYQWGNPDPQLAEGYTGDALLDLVHDPRAVVPALETGSNAAEKAYPTLEAERVIIKAEWDGMEKLRPLLTRPPRPEDIPALQALMRERSRPAGPKQQNVITEIAEQRLAELHVKAD